MSDRELVEMGAAILGSGYGRKDGAWDAKVDAWLLDEAKAAPAKQAALAALANAREGTSLLCGHLRALTPEDWQFLASLCAPDVGAAFYFRSRRGGRRGARGRGAGGPDAGSGTGHAFGDPRE